MLTALVVVASLFAAQSVANNDADEARQSFRQSSAEVASKLQLAIQHQEDLVVSAAGYVVENPDTTSTAFANWFKSVRAQERYPEVKAFGLGTIVPDSELAAYAAQAEKDPSGPLIPAGRFMPLPPGQRPYYCFVQANAYKAETTGPPPTTPAEMKAAGILPAGLDLCAVEEGGTGILALRDTGVPSYFPNNIGGGSTKLLITTPVYRGGDVPKTIDERRASYIGGIATLVSPQVVLAAALAEHPDMAVTFSFRQGNEHATFSRGKRPAGAASVSMDLHNGWTVQTYGTVLSSKVFGNRNASTLLMVGVLCGILLGGFVFMLGTGRARALRLVQSKTGELRHQALHDALTGLPNRALIMDRIEQLLARNRRNGTLGAALFVDLDDFKNINDTLGHEAGDRLLIAVAARMMTTLRDADTIGRMGGDEFVVLIDGDSKSPNAAELVAERLIDVMRQPFELDGATMPLMVNTSIGVAVGDRETGGDLLRDADVALYEAKGSGKNCYEIFRPEMQTEVSRRLELEFELRSAVEANQFRLVYQPIYNLDDLTIVGVEALLRWEHPELGNVVPDEFIPILEQTGQIQHVGRWVLREACEQMALWHSRGDTLDISVNVSGRQLDHDDIVEHVREALENSGLDARSLIVEITESALMSNTTETARRLAGLKELGVRIAVDDFGTGYSSLSYLQQFPVDCLKIDRSFTQGITTSPESKALIGTLVQLGRDLGLRTLAEGIETTSEMDHLRDEHVNEAQGFLLSRPLDPETLETQLLAPTRPMATGQRQEPASSTPPLD